MNEFKQTLIPVNGLMVIDPATSRALPPDGAEVRGHQEYWIRRLNEGDVIAADEQRTEGEQS